MTIPYSQRIVALSIAYPRRMPENRPTSAFNSGHSAGAEAREFYFVPTSGRKPVWTRATVKLWRAVEPAQKRLRRCPDFRLGTSRSPDLLLPGAERVDSAACAVQTSVRSPKTGPESLLEWTIRGE